MKVNIWGKKTFLEHQNPPMIYRVSKDSKRLFIVTFKYIGMHCSFLVLGNSTKILQDIWHQFWHKNDGKKGAIEIIFKSHEPFQSYLLTGLANSA